MRLAFVILALTAIAAGMVAVRKDEIQVSHETRELQSRYDAQRSQLWQQDAQLADLRVLDAVRRRAAEQGVALQPPGQAVANAGGRAGGTTHRR